jgi:hypothetical protein
MTLLDLVRALGKPERRHGGLLTLYKIPFDGALYEGDARDVVA